MSNDIRKRVEKICHKYMNINKFFEPLIENDFVEIPFVAKKLINQVLREILDELEK